jgi:hypothetical protein
MDGHLIGLKRPRIGATALLVALVIVVAMLAVQTTRLWSDTVRAPAVSIPDRIVRNGGVGNLAATHDRHIGSRGGPYDDQATWLTTVDPLLESGTFGHRKTH